MVDTVFNPVENPAWGNKKRKHHSRLSEPLSVLLCKGRGQVPWKDSRL